MAKALMPTAKQDHATLVNVFHLARYAAPERKLSPEQIIKAERLKIRDRLHAMFFDKASGDGGYQVGWNAAIDAAIWEIFRSD